MPHKPTPIRPQTGQDRKNLVEPAMSHPTPAQPDNDEIDLIQLAQTLWQSKVLILVITLVVTGIAAGYAFLSTPVYQTTVRILPPTTNDLLSYNTASQLANGGLSNKKNLPTGQQHEPLPGFNRLSVEAAYTIFLRNLESTAVRTKFSEKYTSIAQAIDDLKVAPPAGNSTNRTTSLTVTGKDPQAIADWANAYVEFALEASRTEIMDSFASQISVAEQGVENEIAAARQIAKQNRQNHIERLKDALAIAETLGLETPKDAGPVVVINTNSVDNDNGLFYVRGTRALRLELQQLKDRQNDDPYIAGLPKLQAKKALLNHIDAQSVSLAAATVDTAASVPLSPIKPRKSVILALGFVLGGMLGIFAALFRDTLRRYV